MTTSRADFGIYAPVVAELRSSELLSVNLLVSGNHVVEEKGSEECLQAAKTLAAEAEVALAGVVPMPIGRGDAAAVAQAMAAVTAGAARLFAVSLPDVMLVLGDRYEMHAVVVAASAFRVPLAHIHGGEESRGALDNAYRHSISKLSHLHFCATEASRRRLLQMGEEPWRVKVTGAPALDDLRDFNFMSRREFFQRLQLPETEFLLATFHPETIAIDKTMDTFEALLAALERLGNTVIFSRANADEAGQEINRRLDAAAAHSPWLHIRDNLGRQAYFSAMHHASAMVGNSSSGIIEAASFGLPVVNIGNRQSGRERSPNTLDAEGNPESIRAALEKVLSPTFRSDFASGTNLYFRGGASSIIRSVLETISLDTSILAKRFPLYDLPL